MKIYVVGVFDLLHSGHFNLLYKSKNLYENVELIVGICSDELTFKTKKRYPVYNEKLRKEIIEKLDLVDKVIIYKDLDHSQILNEIKPDVFVVPPEYGYLQEHTKCIDFANQNKIEIKRFDRTDSISTTELIKINNLKTINYESENEKISKNFWISKNAYPSYKFIKQRRFYEVEYILKKLNFQKINKLVDLGCGDGGLVKCIDNLIEIENINCFDISESLMSNIPDNPKIKKEVFDCSDESYYDLIPSCDVLVFGGVLNYVYEDEKLIKLLNKFEAQHVFIRCVCTSKQQDEWVNTFSQQLKENYSCLYRTVDSTCNLIKKSNLKIEECTRIYPDEIESEFGTKQYMIYCKKNTL